MTYDIYGRTEPSRIYLARPGKRTLGYLEGIDPSSCQLTVDFINADTITFNVYKYHDGELTAYYNYVDILMELFVDGYGWFIINEIPAIQNDGMDEYKTVNAQSYESSLQQYDLVDFDVNVATPTSREMLATDNVYTYTVSKEVWYNLFRDRVLFWRDSRSHKALLDEMDENTTYAQLQDLLVGYPKVVQTDWRIQIKIDDSLRAGFVYMKEHAATQTEEGIWQTQIDAYDGMMASDGNQITSDSVKSLLLSYPELIAHISLDIDKAVYCENEDGNIEKTDDEYTAYELMEREYRRIKELSLLDLVISDVPGWEIGEVDRNLYDEHADDNGNPILLQNEVGCFEVDSQDVYSFLVNELAGFFECIFQFDTVNNRINAYRIETLGDDTQIFIGFRNVQNNVTITPAQDLYTQFTVENSEGLSLTYANFGQREIEDISYFLNTKYLPQELIDKYNRYVAFKESKRDEYIQLCRDYNKQQEVCAELVNRVPSDMLNIAQLEGYKSTDQLEETIDNYYALMIGMLNSFIYITDDSTDPPEDRETYQDYDDYIDDMNDYIEFLEGLIDQGKDESAATFEESLYYKDYYLMKEFTVPNLIIAYHNLQLPSYETKQDYYDAFEFNFDDENGYGWLYGIDELKVYQQSHLDKMDALSEYKTAWANIPTQYREKYTESDYIEKHNLYVKYENGYNSATAAIARRQAEYDDAKAILDDIDDDRQELVALVKMETWVDTEIQRPLYEENEDYLYQEDELYLTVDNEANSFTDDEIEMLSRFYKHTDYVNDNINYLDLLDNTDDVIDKHIKMYKEAVDELYMQSHPQYIYDTDLDNLLANNEYADFHPDFKVGNFIRLGIDDETQVQLRMITISLNPMTMDENLDITFSNMIQYKARRNDFASLLNSALQSAKNAISARYRRNSDSDNTVQVTYDLVQKILQSSPFANYTQNVQQTTINAATGAFNVLTSDFIKTDELAAEVGNITELHSDSVFANYIKSNLIASSTITADQIVDGSGKTIVDLVNDNIDIGSLTTNLITGQDPDGDYYIDLLAGEIAIDKLITSDGYTAIDFVNSSIDIGSITTDIITGRDDQGNYYIDLLAGEIAIDRLVTSNGDTAIDFVNSSIDMDTIYTNLITGQDGNDDYYIDLLTGHLNMDTITTNLITGQDGNNDYYIDLVSGALNLGTIYSNFLTATDGAGDYYIDLLTGQLNMDTITTNLITGQDDNDDYYIDLLTGALNMDTVYTNLITGQDGNNQYYIDLLTGELNMDTIATSLITGTDGNDDYYIDLISGALNMDTITTNLITGQDENSQYYIDLVSGALNLGTVYTNFLTAMDGSGNYYVDLLSGELNMDTITTNLITGHDGNNNYYIDMVSGALNMDTIYTNLITGTDGNDEYYIDLLTGALNMDTIYTNLITGTDGNDEYYVDLLTGHLNMDTITTNLITGTNGNNQYYIDLISGALNMDTIAANSGFINTLVSQNAFISTIQSLSSTTAQSVINDAYIYNAVAGKITVADLLAADIVLSDQMRILTANNATEGIVMSGSELQFLDGNGNPSISIGYNTVSDGEGGTTVDYSSPAIIIKDANGSVMLNSSGLSQGDVGLAPMIQTASIAKNQLNFPIVDTDANGNISITNIKDGTGGNFGVEYTSFKQGTQAALDEIESKKMYRVVVESDNGNIFKNGDVNCTLSCRVYSWDDEVTDDINAAYFIWTRKSKNTSDDTAWNARHISGRKTITITPEDVYGRSVFYCTVTLPDGTTQSSN